MDKSKEGFVSKSLFVTVFLFITFSLWLLYLVFSGQDPESRGAQIWASTYQIIAWFGAFCGLFFANLWGGWESRIGRANLAFAFGLLAQSFGQSVFGYYYFNGIDVPYPSLADLGYFGSIPIYIYAIFVLAKISGASLSFKLVTNKVFAFFVPLVILLASYFLFLKDYAFDPTNPLIALLDFGYPIGQSIYLSLAIVAYFLTKDYLGGLMKSPMMLFIAALFIQAVADFVFLYQVSNDIYVGGLEVDYLYLVAYFMMAYSLIKLGQTYYKIQNS